MTLSVCLSLNGHRSIIVYIFALLMTKSYFGNQEAITRRKEKNRNMKKDAYIL